MINLEEETNGEDVEELEEVSESDDEPASRDTTFRRPLRTRTRYNFI